MKRNLMLAVALASLAAACGEGKRAAPDTPAKSEPAAATSPALGPGEAYLAVPDGRIWYKKTGAGAGTPVILLHGGPGYNSFYLKPLEALGDDRPVIRYDQLGGGRSGPMTDTSLMTIPHFVRELDSLRAALGYDRIHLLGHSWGTILAFEYYRAHPEHVVSLTLGSAALDIPTWERNARRLVGTLSDSAQRAIRVREAEQKFDAPDYQRALEEFYGKYVWRHPVDADLDSTIKTAISGTLKTYDVTHLLPTIKVPTLYTVGQYDEADPPTIRRFASMTPGATVEVIPGAAHITTWDNSEVMVRVVRRFLRKVDAGGARARN